MKVRDLIKSLKLCPPDADVLIEHHEEGRSVPWYRSGYTPSFYEDAPYPETKKEHPKGVVIL